MWNNLSVRTTRKVGRITEVPGLLHYGPSGKDIWELQLDSSHFSEMMALDAL